MVVSRIGMRPASVSGFPLSFTIVLSNFAIPNGSLPMPATGSMSRAMASSAGKRSRSSLDFAYGHDRPSRWMCMQILAFFLLLSLFTHLALLPHEASFAPRGLRPWLDRSPWQGSLWWRKVPRARKRDAGRCAKHRGEAGIPRHRFAPHSSPAIAFGFCAAIPRFLARRRRLRFDPGPGLTNDCRVKKKTSSPFSLASPK